LLLDIELAQQIPPRPLATDTKTAENHDPLELRDSQCVEEKVRPPTDIQHTKPSSQKNNDPPIFPTASFSQKVYRLISQKFNAVAPLDTLPLGKENSKIHEYRELCILQAGGMEKSGPNSESNP
jgi:hypothetical protein